MWTCGKCQETHEDQFDTCWRCGAAKVIADIQEGSTVTQAANEQSNADKDSSRSDSPPTQGEPVNTSLETWLLSIAQVISLIWCIVTPVRGIIELGQLARIGSAPGPAIFVIFTRGLEFLFAAAMVVVFSRVNRWPVDERRTK